MDPARHGWPQQGGSAHGDQQQGQRQQQQFGPGAPQHPSQQSPPLGHTGLPPMNSHAGYQQQNHGLSNLAGLSQFSPRQPAHRPEGPQALSFPLPGLGQATGQPSVAEREQIHIKEEQDRAHREQQERQRLEQAPQHQTQGAPPMHLHQPVAVGPRHGLLGGPLGVAQGQPNFPLGAPPGPGNIFAGGTGPVAQAPGPPGQPGPPTMLMPPFGPGPQAQAAQQQQQQAQQQMGQAPGQQPILNDALSYLDQVKVQFADHPDVYNRFLDIMKDFKSGAIDTPGVIGRVSQLFAGNPELIQGFNTFLPPGYRIECGTGDDPNAIRVTTPMGTTVQSMPAPRPLSRQDGARPNGTYTPQPGPGPQMMLSPSGRAVVSGMPGSHLSPLEAARQEQQAMHQQQERGVNQLANAVSAATGGASIRAGMSPGPGRVTPLPQDHAIDAGMEKRGPVEFNHAISYVNKIKNRFSSQPDIYKQFLEILQTYQRESKPIQDVYSQVTQLFKSAPDLLDDFKQFLPESAAAAKAHAQRVAAEEQAMLSNARGEPMYGSPVMSREVMGTPSHGRGLPPVGNFAPTPIVKDNKRKRGERQGTVNSAAEPGAQPSAVKGQFAGPAGKVSDGDNERLLRVRVTPTKAPPLQHPQHSQPKLLALDSDLLTPIQRMKQPTTMTKVPDQPPTSPTLVPALPTPLPPTTSTAATSDELSFFDRTKKTIGNKNTFNEFLKLCNLFSQDLIDRTALVHRARSFIGGNAELLSQFERWVGYEEKDVLVENRPRVPSGRVNLSNCRGLGPSYRLLPKRLRTDAARCVVFGAQRLSTQELQPPATRTTYNIRSNTSRIPATIAMALKSSELDMPSSPETSPLAGGSQKSSSSSPSRASIDAGVLGKIHSFPQSRKLPVKSWTLEGAQHWQNNIARHVAEPDQTQHAYRPDHATYFSISDAQALAQQKTHKNGKKVINANNHFSSNLQERQKPCSGRDELCNAVLNDEWASHPTWASEDSGFVAHKKNVNEEGLHRIEEERHDYDFNIEACSRTIQLLEPLAHQLKRLSEPEQVAYKLPPGLGGQSETIYKRVIMKVYGREKGNDVVNQLHAYPYQVIPVILNRLKERLETWKLAQREWEKVWREQTQKMFWKSLDHQHKDARASDKRAFQIKTLQTEIQVKHEEMIREEKQVMGVMRKPQLEFNVEDTDVLIDAARLILAHADEVMVNESPKLPGWLREFIPLFFGLDVDYFNSQVASKKSPSDTPAEAADDSPSGAEDSTPSRGRKGKTNNLLRTALSKGQGKLGRKDREDSYASASRASTPDIASNADDEMAIDTTDDSETKQEQSASRWLDYPADGNGLGTRNVDPAEAYTRTTYRMWSNTQMFCFVRIFIMLYERLLKLKHGEQECRRTVAKASASKPAIDLGIIDKLPQDYFEDVSDTANYYRQMLAKFEKVLVGEGDFAEIEEVLRRFYLQSGYQLYALEKLVQAFSRFGINIMTGDSKDKSFDMYHLFKKDRVREATTAQQQTDYRRGVEKMLKDGELYRIDFLSATRQVRFYLTRKSDPTLDSALSPTDLEHRWRYYIASYTAFPATEGLELPKLAYPVLARTIRSAGANPHSTSYPPSPTSGSDAQRVRSMFTSSKGDENLVLRVAVDNYKGYFTAGTGETFFAPAEVFRGVERVDGSEAVEGSRGEMMREGFGFKNAATEDVGTEVVERANEVLRGVVGGGLTETGDEMEG